MVNMAQTGRSQVSPHPPVPNAMKFVGTVVRSVFIVTLMAVTWSVSMPQNISATALAHFSAGDFVRALIGIAVCCGMIVELVRPPKDDEGYKTWVFIGVGLAFVWVIFLVLKLALPTTGNALGT
jgi:hypothetical protein